MGFWKKFLNWLTGGGNEPTPVTPPPTTVYDVRPLFGMNVQGAFRSVLHGTKDPEVIADKLANVLMDAGATSIRIPGGKPSHGFWIQGPGYGEAKYAGMKAVDNPPVPVDEPNYFQICLMVAQKANIPVWITLHTFMTKEDIAAVYNACREAGVKIQGVSISNEPYAPEYVKAGLVDEEVARFPQLISWLRELGYDDYIGVPVIVGLGDPAREERAKEYNDKVRMAIPLSRFHDDNERLCLDIHPYFAPDDFLQFTPSEYFNWFMDQVNALYGTKPKVVITEWAKKNQWEFSEDVAGRVIEEYLEEFMYYDDRIIAAHYQSIGGRKTQGMYDFESGTFNDRVNYFVL